MERMLTVREVIRALDTILIKIDCPKCSALDLVGLEADTHKCGSCNEVTEIMGFDIEGASRRNIVAHPKGNRRIRVGKKVVQKLFVMQEGYCAYCSADLRNIEYHVEHILPLSYGGSNKLHNLALSCPPCNLTASAKVFTSFLAKKNYITGERLRKADLSRQRD